MLMFEDVQFQIGIALSRVHFDQDIKHYGTQTVHIDEYR